MTNSPLPIGRFSTAADVVTEVEYQVAEYDCSESEAIENIADECDLPWKVVADVLYDALGVVF